MVNMKKEIEQEGESLLEIRNWGSIGSDGGSLWISYAHPYKTD